MKRPLFEAHRANVERTTNAVVRVTRLQARYQVIGVGEVVCDVVFPIKFVELPHLSVGAELDKTSVSAAGNFPTASACVTGWTNENAAPGHEGLYVAASLALVVTGSPGQRMWVHLTFDGKAMRNPVIPIEGVDDVL